MKVKLIVTLLLFFLCSCSEHFESDYFNKEEIIQDDAILRGWIPSCIPQSAKNIHEWHDLDTNLGYGSFEFNIIDIDSLKIHLERIDSNQYKMKSFIDNRSDWDNELTDYPKFEDFNRAGFDLYKYEYFYLAINSKLGQAYFWHKYR